MATNSANLFPQFTGHPAWYSVGGSASLQNGQCTIRTNSDGAIVLNGSVTDEDKLTVILLRHKLNDSISISDVKLAKGTYEFGIDNGAFQNEFEGFTIWEERKSGGAWVLPFTPYSEDDWSVGTFEVGGNERDLEDSTGYVFFAFTLKKNHYYGNFTFRPILREVTSLNPITIRDLYTGTGAHVFPENYFQAGRIYWRVRNTDLLGRVGEWSDTVSFFAYGIPVVSDLSCDEKPFVTVSWTTPGQIAYEIRVDDEFSYGPYHGDEQTFTLPEPLENGAHKISVQVQNRLNLLSEWKSVEFTVRNVPSSEGELELQVMAEIDAELHWETVESEEDDEFLVYRDGELIERLGSEASAYLDRVVLGEHTYSVIQRKSSGYYNKYTAGPVWLESNVTRIARLDGGNWLDLLLTRDQYPTNTFNQSATVERVQVMGSKYPIVEVSEFEELRGSYEVVWPYTEREEAYKFRDLIGEAVIMKSRGEQVLIGVLEAFELPVNSQTVGYSFSIEQMGTEKDLSGKGEIVNQLVPLRVTKGGIYLPSSYGAYGFGAVEVDVYGGPGGNGSDLDIVKFGDMTQQELAAVTTNPGYTNPQWYEEIAEAINDALEGSGGSGAGGSYLDNVKFGDMTTEQLREYLTNPGATDPQWYENIAEALDLMIKKIQGEDVDFDIDLAGTGDYSDLTDLDGIMFGRMDEDSLGDTVTNPGITDPKWYEAIADALNVVKGQAGSEPSILEGKVIHERKLVEQSAVTVSENGTYDTTLYGEVTVNVPETGLELSQDDEGKVVSDGALVAQTASTVTKNGTYDTTYYGEVSVNVSNSYTANDEGKVVFNGNLVSQNVFAIDENGSYNTSLYGEVSVNVENSYTANDEGKVVQNGELVSQSSLTINTNGSYNTSLYGEVVVSVPIIGLELSREDEGKVVSDGTLVSQSSLIIDANGSYNTSLYGDVTVVVENSYSAVDEGKVVQNGELIAQASSVISENGAYDTTLYSEVIVNVQNGIEDDTNELLAFLVGSVTSIMDMNGVVKNVDDYTFYNNPYIQSVRFPSCETIGYAAFRSCYSLTSISFPACTFVSSAAFSSCITLAAASFPACSIIGSGAFCDCKRLKSINFPICTSIFMNAFRSCYEIQTASFPACEYIGEQAFYCCSSLSSIIFPVCTRIRSYAFGNCRTLAYVSFSLCTSIPEYAFGGCYSLEAVSFPACTSIGWSAFISCRNLVSVDFPVCVTLSSSVFQSCIKLMSANFPVCTSIGTAAFYDCYALSEVSFPACTTISSYAFRGCSALTEVSFPACMTISSYAFALCQALTKASFPACTMIGTSAFHSCSALVSLYFLGSQVASLMGTLANVTSSSALSIYVPASLYRSYLAQSRWAVYSSRIVSYEISGNSHFSASTSLATLQLSGENISVSGTKLQLTSENVSVSGTKITLG